MDEWTYERGQITIIQKVSEASANGWNYGKGQIIIIQKVSETSADGWMNLYWRGQILKCESAISERSAVVVLGHSPSPPPQKRSQSK
jgi:hypothetical protein